MPHLDDLFSETYSVARDRFLDASRAHGAFVRSFEHPLPGPNGETLYCDVADVGPSQASAVHLLIAGTHGVEGFLGSAVLIDLLSQGPAPNVRMLLVHGINPWGFANLCRFTENNVDLNRNFVDFSASLP